MAGCESCKAYQFCKSPKFVADGRGDRDILLIFDHATKREDNTGVAFNNTEHHYIYDILSEYGLKETDVYMTHAVQCYQPDLEKKKIPVSTQSIAGCHTRLMATIRRFKPKKIFVFGDIAMKTLYHNVDTGRFSFTRYERFPGFIIPDQELKALVIPVFNPEDAVNELIRRKNNILKYRPDSKFSKNILQDKFLRTTDSFRVLDRFIRDQIQNGLNSTFFKKNVPDTQILETEEDVRKILRKLLNMEAFAFDIETTGLKPFAPEHHIYTWGFSNGKEAWAFYHPTERSTLRLLQRVLTSDVEKYGWNIQYESIWIRHLLGYEVNNWAFDGQIGSHVLDNRAGITSLKFQTYIREGIVGYDSEIDPFLKSAGGGNGTNKITQADPYKILQYNGNDAYFTFVICEKQSREIKKSAILSKGYKLLHDGQIALSKMTSRGVHVDTVLLQKNWVEMDKKAIKLYRKIMNSEEVKNWKGFNPGSGADLVRLFYDNMGFEVTERTKEGIPSTKSEVLENFHVIHGCEIAKDIADYKKALQTRDTFLEGIRRETYNNEVHPFFSLNLVASYRSSSQSPNFQNYPKRDESVMKVIRSVFKPRDGYVFMDVDYKSLEGFMGCNYHNDSQMSEYLLNEDTDMHADMAQDIFKVKKEDADPAVFSKMRSVGKTANFALQYGSSARMLAYNLWHGHMSAALKSEMESVGISSFQEWDTHIREIYRIYWEERFKELNEWRSDTWETYVRNGYVVSNMGFMYNSLMTQNQVGNYPIQGSGFNVLLEGINTMTAELEHKHMNSCFIIEVHDSIVLEVHEDEVEEVKSMIRKHFVEDIKKRHTWMTMPLSMSGEIYRENWADHDKSEDFFISA